MITDLSYIKSLAGEDDSFIRDMINIFREQVDEYSREMPELLEQSDYINLSKLAHKAKSSVAVMGMKSVSEILQNLEIMAKTGEKSEEYRNIVETFISSSQQAVEELVLAYP